MLKVHDPLRDSIAARIDAISCTLSSHHVASSLFSGAGGTNARMMGTTATRNDTSVEKIRFIIEASITIPTAMSTRLQILTNLLCDPRNMKSMCIHRLITSSGCESCSFATERAIALELQNHGKG